MHSESLTHVLCVLVYQTIVAMATCTSSCSPNLSMVVSAMASPPHWQLTFRENALTVETKHMDWHSYKCVYIHAWQYSGEDQTHCYKVLHLEQDIPGLLDIYIYHSWSHMLCSFLAMTYAYAKWKEAGDGSINGYNYILYIIIFTCSIVVYIVPGPSLQHLSFEISTI